MYKQYTEINTISSGPTKTKNKKTKKKLQKKNKNQNLLMNLFYYATECNVGPLRRVVPCRMQLALGIPHENNNSKYASQTQQSAIGTTTHSQPHHSASNSSPCPSAQPSCHSARFLLMCKRARHNKQAQHIATLCALKRREYYSQFAL